MTVSGRLSQRSKLSSLLSQGGTKQLGEAVLKHSERLSSAKTRLKFSAEEAAILKQEAELNANKIILRTKREVEEAKCNLEALYDMSDLGESYAPLSNVEDNPYEAETVIQRTKSYVDSQSDTRSPNQDRPPNEDENESNLPQRQSDNTVEPTSYFVPSANGVQANNMNSTGFNPQTPHTGLTDMNTCSEFAKVFAKKDLVSKIHIFDDNPKNFSSWKASFKNAVKELSPTPMEEMDLLIQWLGNTSSATQAKSIRNATASNPGRGLQRIWDRLQDRFANPEVVESAIKRKLAKFPKLGNKDSTKL